ncbi:MAG: hypothetical protein K2G63_04550 [Oscillospiraceae bacterium]|nr:hypothetical protein [Oscillospiraceae bacterium]
MSRTIECDTEKDKEICRKRSEYGKKGRASICKQKQADIERDIDIVNEIVSDIENDIEAERFSVETENLLKIYSDVCRSLPKTKKINKKDIKKYKKSVVCIFGK